MAFEIEILHRAFLPENKKGRDGHGPVHKKGRGQLWSAHGPVDPFRSGRYGQTSLKKPKKAKKSENAAHLEVPVHDLPLAKACNRSRQALSTLFFRNAPRTSLPLFPARFLLGSIV
jgi:hypothetical protein